MPEYVFLPEWEILVSHAPHFYPPDEILREKGMYAASEEFAYQHGGNITRMIIQSIPESYRRAADTAGKQLNIDVRMHSLKVGDYPATPGWHCDASQRETTFEQNAVTTPVEQTIIYTFSSHPGGVSNTEFLTTPCTINSPHPPGDDLWACLDDEIRCGKYSHHTIRDGQWVTFSDRAPHRASPAHNTGVRGFIRVSMWDRPANVTSKLTRTEQVYRVKLL